MTLGATAYTGLTVNNIGTIAASSSTNTDFLDRAEQMNMDIVTTDHAINTSPLTGAKFNLFEETTSHSHLIGT